MIYISKVHIVGFRCFKDFTVEFNKGKNIIVGNNGTGKSTILDAIHLCLTGLHRGQSIQNVLSPFLFNRDNVEAYLQMCRQGDSSLTLLPHITIEVYLSEEGERSGALALCEGDYNISRDIASGIRLDIKFNDEYQEEYAILMQANSGIQSIPIEYYHCERQTFSRMQISPRVRPIRSQLIDSSAIVNHRGPIDIYLNRLINDQLSVKDRITLSTAFRQMKETFSSNTGLTSIIDKIDVLDKELSLVIDPSVSTNWESLLVAKVNEIPFHYIGKGEQCMIKTHLVLGENKTNESVLLLEEPENHLSHSSLHKFLSQIEERGKTNQVITTTHSSMVCNKLDLSYLILLGKGDSPVYFKDLCADTRNFFKKASGFDTLRIVLSSRSIIVEGPSDELIIQKAYLLENGCLPIEAGVDVISVAGLGFKRYISLISKLNNRVAIVTDNDAEAEKKEERYRDFMTENIHFFISPDNSARTLELQIIQANTDKLANLAKILNRENKQTKEELQEYMLGNKTEAALLIFESEDIIDFPQYIQDALKWLKIST